MVRLALLTGLGRNRDFLKLWAGQSVSLFGSQVTRLALPLAAVLTLHAGAAQMGLLGAALLTPYLVFGLFAGVVVRTSEAPPTSDHRPGAWAELREGLVLVVGQPWLRAIAGCTATLNFFANLLMTVYILYATSSLGLPPALIGAIFAVGGVSTIFGTMLAGPVARRLGIGRALLGASLVIGIAGLLIPIAAGPGPVP